MKHRIGFNPLGRKPSHRKALHKNMVTSLFKHERIRTTKTKAKAIRRTAEKMITRAKVDSVHNRRMIARDLKDKAILAKLFVEIGPRFKERPGGYTRILKIGPRPGDAAEMVLLELVKEVVEKPESNSGRGNSAKKSVAAKTEKSAGRAKTKSVKAERTEAAVDIGRGAAEASSDAPEVETPLEESGRVDGLLESESDREDGKEVPSEEPATGESELEDSTAEDAEK